MPTPLSSFREYVTRGKHARMRLKRLDGNDCSYNEVSHGNKVERAINCPSNKSTHRSTYELTPEGEIMHTMSSDYEPQENDTFKEQPRSNFATGNCRWISSEEAVGLCEEVKPEMFPCVSFQGRNALMCKHVERLDALNRSNITTGYSLRTEEFLEKEDTFKSYPKVGWVETNEGKKSKFWECLSSPM